MTNAPDTNNPPSGGVVLPRTSNRGLPVNVQNMADMAPAFNLRWDSSRAAYYVDKPNIGDTAVYTAEQVAALQQQLAAAREALQAAEADELQTIRERDAAEDALGRMFHAVTGRVAEWSSAWHFTDAIEEAEDHGYAIQKELDIAREALQRISVVEPYDALSYKANEIARAALATLQRDRQP